MTTHDGSGPMYEPFICQEEIAPVALLELMKVEVEKMGGGRRYEGREPEWMI